MEGIKTLPREPWRGSMICGYQVSSGGWGRPMEFCAERKADGLPMCEAHFDEVMAEYGHVQMAPGNALGAPRWALRLLWEPHEGDSPIEPSAEEMERYAPLFA
jgi:hypothetical protein